MSAEKNKNSNIDRQLAFVLEKLHAKWVPHNAQKLVIKAVFGEMKKRAFLECGRKFGKDEIIAYMLWRWALSAKDQSCYYLAPYQVQAKEIIWANRRIIEFGPTELIKGRPNNSEMRINFRNGSFIKIDGSDNFDRYRGITPHFVVYNEFKDFRPEFHPAMAPNLAPKKAPLVIAGTPPDDDESAMNSRHQFFVLADEIKNDPDGAYFNFPSWANPHLDRDYIKKEKQALYARGEGQIFEREYAARRVRGGPGSIFPMWSRNFVRPHDVIMDLIAKDKRKLEWLCIADPGTVTVFALLFVAINPFKKTVYILDEIYIKDQESTSTSVVMPRIQAIKDELFEASDSWTQGCDEAAAWFINEAWVSFQEHFIATQKALNKKEAGLSLIKDLLLQKRVLVSERCVNFCSEMDGYKKDKNGQIPKINDHAIDCLRYALGLSGVSLVEEHEPVDLPDHISDQNIRRKERLSDEFDEDFSLHDLDGGFL